MRAYVPAYLDRADPEIRALEPFHADVPNTIGELRELLLSVCQNSFGNIHVRLRSADAEYRVLLFQLQTIEQGRNRDDPPDATTQKQASRFIQIFTTAVDEKLGILAPAAAPRTIQAAEQATVVDGTIRTLRELKALLEQTDPRLLGRQGARLPEEESHELRVNLAGILWSKAACRTDDPERWEKELSPEEQKKAAKLLMMLNAVSESAHQATQDSVKREPPESITLAIA